MTRRFRPRRVDPFPEGLLPVTCDACGYRGAFDWRRGLVLHPLSPTCDVRVPDVAEPDEHEEAA